MMVIVGLGNPGDEYSETRHNAGFAVLDRLAEKLRISFQEEKKFQSLIARPKDKEILLIKPTTFMNRSGDAVAAIAKFYKVKPDHLWVVYDDVDLPTGTARVRGKGTGESSHRGVQSIVRALGSAVFSRFRVGIAHATGNAAAERPHQPVDLKAFVLSPFDRREQPLVEQSIGWVVEEILAALKRGQVISRTLAKGV